MTALSKREKEVLEGLKKGKSALAIGNDLGISHRTVKIHKHIMFTKMGVHSSLEAVAKAAKDGL